MPPLLLALLFAFGVSAQSNCGLCTTDSDCANCRTSKIVTSHTLIYSHAPQVHYFCNTSTPLCNINVMSTVSVQQSCKSDAGCCIPSGNHTADVAFCQSKACKAATGCDPRGFCTYNNTDVYDGCCRHDSDCPSTPSPPAMNAFETACFVPTCTASNCRYAARSRCCVSNSDCDPQPSAPVARVCAPDPNLPGENSCVNILTTNGQCSSDSSCLPRSSGCAIGLCNQAGGPHCSTSPQMHTSGCCTDSTTAGLSNCALTPCKRVIGCQNNVTDHGGVDELPNFNCIFDDATARGCCSDLQNNQCAALAAESSCIAPSSESPSGCDVSNNRCILRASSGGSTCCYTSDQCGIPDQNNLCSFFVCTGPPRAGVAPADAYKCVEKSTAPPCTPETSMATLSANGPFTFSCQWANCNSSNANTIQALVEINNTDSGPRESYGFNIILLIFNGVSSETVISTTLNQPVQTTSIDRTLPNGLFQVTSTTFGTTGLSQTAHFEQFFNATDFFTLDPGESLILTFLTAFAGDAVVNGYRFEIATQEFLPCTPFFFGHGTPNCNTQADVTNNNRILGDVVVQPTSNAVASFPPCSPQCFNNPPPGTTVGGGTETPTATMTTGPPPTPPPVQSTGTDRTVTMELIDCTWNCSDSADKQLNRFKFRITETNLFPVTILTSGAYVFTWQIFRSNPFSLAAYSDVMAPFPNDASMVDADGQDLSFITHVELGDGVRFNANHLGREIAPGESVVSEVAFFLSLSASDITLVGAEVQLRTQSFNYNCDQTAVQLGECSSSQLGHSFFFSNQLPPEVLSFGNDTGGSCTANACSGRPGTFNFDLFHTVNVSSGCDIDCRAGSNVSAQNSLFFKICFHNSNIQPNAEPLFLRGLNFTFRSPDTNPDGSEASTTFKVPLYYFEDLSLSVDDPPVAPSQVEITSTNNTDESAVFSEITVYPQHTSCMTLRFFRNPQFPLRWPLIIEFTTLMFVACTTVEVQDGLCVPPFTAFAAGPGEIAALTIGSEATEGFLQSCSDSLCSAGSLPSDEIGGRVFFDANSDGVFDNGETGIAGVLVDVVDVKTQTVLASQLTDANGFFAFNATDIFSATVTDVVFVIPVTAIPAGTQITITNSPANPTNQNTFSGSPPTSEDLIGGVGFATAFNFMLAGFRPFSCEPNMGPFANTSALIELVAENCTECVYSTARPPPTLTCSPEVCHDAAVRRIVDFTFNVSNFASVEQPPATVIVQFSQAVNNSVVAGLICADMIGLATSPEMFIITSDHGPASRTDKGTVVTVGPRSRKAFATFGWDSIPIGQNVHSFTARVSYCATGGNFQYNITASVRNRYCAPLIQAWSTCSTVGTVPPVDPDGTTSLGNVIPVFDGTTVDFRQCFAQFNNSVASEPCNTVCPSLPPPAPTPTTTTPPPPTFGPNGMSSPIAAGVAFSLDGPMCVNRPLILQQEKCRNVDTALATCRNATRRAIVIASFEMFLKSGAVGQPGIAIITVTRNMPPQSLFCGRFDPEIRLRVLRNGLPLSNKASIMSSRITALQTVRIKIDFLKFDRSTVILLDVASVECLTSVSTPFNYSASLSLQTKGCTDLTACTVTAQLASVTAPLNPTCIDVVDDPLFAEERSKSKKRRRLILATEKKRGKLTKKVEREIEEKRSAADDDVVVIVDDDNDETTPMPTPQLTDDDGDDAVVVVVNGDVDDDDDDGDLDAMSSSGESTAFTGGQLFVIILACLTAAMAVFALVWLIILACRRSSARKRTLRERPRQPNPQGTVAFPRGMRRTGANSALDE